MNEDGFYMTGEQIDSLQSSIASMASPDDPHVAFNFNVHLPDIFESIARVEETMYRSTGPQAMRSWADVYLGTFPQLPLGEMLTSMMQGSTVSSLIMQALASMSRVSRQFSIDADSQVFLDNVVFTPQEYEQALQHFNAVSQTLRQASEALRPSVNILNAILEMWHQAGRQSFPSLGEVVSYVLEEIIITNLSEVPPFILHNLVMTWIARYGYVPSQNILEYIYQYFVLHNNVYPNEEELRNFIINITEFLRSPEEFHARDKHLVPAVGVERIQRFPNEDPDAICCVCQDQIKRDEMVLRLPPCQHIFHANNMECLDGSSVLDWLARSNLCPLCKTKVEVPADQN